MSKVASASEDGTVRVWDRVTGAPIAVFQGPDGGPGKYGSMGVAFVDEGHIVFTGDGADENKPVHFKPV
jgi:hypothetical protein